MIEINQEYQDNENDMEIAKGFYQSSRHLKVVVENL
jgi:hypothetical protein